MRTLLENDTLRQVLSDITYPIADVSVCSAFEQTEHESFPRVVYREIYNHDDRVASAADGGIESGPSMLSYQIDIYCKDCYSADGTKLYPRDIACYTIAETVTSELLKRLNMVQNECGPCFVRDETSCCLPVRFMCSMDKYKYVYTR